MSESLAQLTLSEPIAQLSIQKSKMPILPIAVPFNPENMLRNIGPKHYDLRPIDMDGGTSSEYKPKFKSAVVNLAGEKVIVPLISNLDSIQKRVSVALGCFLSLFGAKGAGQHTGEYVKAVATLTINLLQKDASEKLKASLTYKAYNIEYKETTFAEHYKSVLKVKLEDVGWEQKYLTFLESEEAHLWGVLEICIGLPMIFIGKQISPLCSRTYFFTCYKALTAKTKAISAAEYFEAQNIIPNKTRCIEYNKIVSGLFEFRKVITKCILSTSLYAGPYQQLCKVVLSYLRYSEMTHIDLIITQLVGRCPEALCLNCVVPEQQALDKALSFLRTKPVEERPYTKLLYHHEFCEPLLARHFIFMTAAARIIAAFYNKSYYNYRGDANIKVIQSMENSLIKYLNAKTAAGAHAKTDEQK